MIICYHLKQSRICCARSPIPCGRIAWLCSGAKKTSPQKGVPPGTYTFRLRAANAAGVSAASNPVTLSFPTACSGAPNPPSRFLAYNVGNVVTVVWEPAPSGSAPTGYVLEVSGAFSGAFPTAARTLSGTVGAGTYSLRVRALNACGASAFTAAQSITVP